MSRANFMPASLLKAINIYKPQTNFT